MHRYHNSLGESVQACHNLLFSPATNLYSCYAALVIESANALLLHKDKDDKLYALYITQNSSTQYNNCDPQHMGGSNSTLLNMV